ncbi:hypothetical protein ACFL5V_05430 [Fibrobacterota bacterium]
MDKNLKLSDDLRSQLAQAAVLYKMTEGEEEVDAGLSGANRALQAIMEEGKDEIWKVEKKKYVLTPKGELIWENWKARWWDFLANFDVYAGVDLQEGLFADDEADWDAVDERGNLIWEDLRVAVCLRKTQLARKQGKKTALSPFTITFLALLSEGRLEQSREWQFDIAFDSIFWNEIENIVNSSVWPQELGYEDAPWEEVVDDIIAQGMEVSKQRWESEEDDEGDDGSVEPAEAYTSREEVERAYGREIDEYGYQPGYFYYNPYWYITDTAIAVGAIGMCWAMF